MKTLYLGAFALFCLSVAPSLRATPIVIDFEQFTDSEILSGQIPDLIFSNAIALTAGISLDEFEFPPYSGANVASDDGGPMSIQFLTPFVSVRGYFTYAEPFTVTAYDAAGNVVATAVSLFSNNEALSGVPGSSPNEFLQVDFAGGISMITLEANPNGGSFTLDDLTLTSTPEPGTAPLLLAGAVLILAGLRLRQRGLHRRTRP